MSQQTTGDSKGNGANKKSENTIGDGKGIIDTSVKGVSSSSTLSTTSESTESPMLLKRLPPKLPNNVYAKYASENQSEHYSKKGGRKNKKKNRGSAGKNNHIVGGITYDMTAVQYGEVSLKEPEPVSNNQNPIPIPTPIQQQQQQQPVTVYHNPVIVAPVPNVRGVESHTGLNAPSQKITGTPDTNKKTISVNSKAPGKENDVDISKLDMNGIDMLYAKRLSSMFGVIRINAISVFRSHVPTAMAVSIFDLTTHEEVFSISHKISQTICPTRLSKMLLCTMAEVMPAVAKHTEKHQYPYVDRDDRSVNWICSTRMFTCLEETCVRSFFTFDMDIAVNVFPSRITFHCPSEFVNNIDRNRYSTTDPLADTRALGRYICSHAVEFFQGSSDNQVNIETTVAPPRYSPPHISSKRTRIM